MNLLLDTHIILWWLADDPALSEKVRAAIMEPTNTIFVSAASAWEVAIKQALGKLIAPDNFEEEIALNGFEPLVITFNHAKVAANLPRHHEDPFDRMLLAQAQIEKMTLVTKDTRLAKYQIPLLLS